MVETAQSYVESRHIGDTRPVDLQSLQIQLAT